MVKNSKGSTNKGNGGKPAPKPNPNWPSKNPGKPSGGGRGNNPPKS